MRIKLTSVPINDIDEALAFYVGKLGFIRKQDIPMGDTRFVTVVSPDDPDGTELMLEPNGDHGPTRVYKKALREEGVPFAAFEVDDIQAEYERLTALGVAFRSEPKTFGSETIASCDDTCGNLVMIYEKTS